VDASRNAGERLRIHFVRTGGPLPPLVLAHGATDSGTCWGRVAVALADRFDVIAPDARGHGQTDAPEDDYSRTAMAADLAAFIGALDLDHSIVAGHPMGAATVLTLVATHPNIAKAAILEDPGFRLGNGDGARMSTMRARMRDEYTRRQSMTHAEVVAARKAGHPLWHDGEFEAWADAKKRVSAAFLFADPAASRSDWRALLPDVAVPVLHVTSDAPPAGNGIVNVPAADVARNLRPTHTVAHVPGAGHNIRRERFEAFMAAVTPILGTHS
jgi:pimeloyl-ACP methyl ester carboxylesterase